MHITNGKFTRFVMDIPAPNTEGEVIMILPKRKYYYQRNKFTFHEEKNMMEARKSRNKKI
jgi:hypothetical protein